MGAYVLALMFLIGGVVFALLGYSNLVRTRKERATWLARVGTVVDMAEETDDKGKPLYAPIYRYTTDGREYTAKSNIAARPARYRIGDSIPVVVNPTKPNDSEALDGSISLFTYGMMIMGIVVLAVGVLVAWLALSGRMKFD